MKTTINNFSPSPSMTNRVQEYWEGLAPRLGRVLITIPKLTFEEVP